MKKGLIHGHKIAGIRRTGLSDEEATGSQKLEPLLYTGRQGDHIHICKETGLLCSAGQGGKLSSVGTVSVWEQSSDCKYSEEESCGRHYTSSTFESKESLPYS